MLRLFLIRISNTSTDLSAVENTIALIFTQPTVSEANSFSCIFLECNIFLTSLNGKKDFEDVFITE